MMTEFRAMRLLRPLAVCLVFALCLAVECGAQEDSRPQCPPPTNHSVPQRCQVPRVKTPPIHWPGNGNSSGKVWEEEERMEVTVFKCSEDVKDEWWEVPGFMQAPLGATKKARIEGRFRDGLFNFSLVVKPLECAYGDVRTFKLAECTKFKNTSHCERFVQYTLNRNYFSPYGDLRTESYSFQYPPHAFCIHTLDAVGADVDVKVCTPRYSHSNTGTKLETTSSEQNRSVPVVIQKCCAPGLVVQFDIGASKRACVESMDEEWTPFFFNHLTALSSGHSFIPSEVDAGVLGKQRPFYSHKSLGCGTTLQFLSHQTAHPTTVAQIRVLESGEILTRVTGQHEWDKPKQTDTTKEYIDPSNICIDGLIASSDFGAEQVYERTQDNQIIFYCKQHENDELTTYSQIYFWMFCVTSVFLFLIVAVYAVIWKEQNIHGWTSAAFSFFVFLFHLSSALLHGSSVFAHQKLILFGSPTCIAIGVLHLYSNIAMFSWMTVLNFDLWVTISSMTPASKRSKGTKRFVGYCAFALGVPLLVLSVALVIDSHFGLFDESVVRPLIGRLRCAVDNSAYVYYHSLPSLLIFLVNAFFAVQTMVTLWAWKRDTQRIHKSNTRASRSQGQLLFKMFVLMGFSWVFDFSSWLVSGLDVAWYFVIFDAFNILQAFALFWIFVCKKEVKDQLSAKYSLFKSCAEFVEKTTSGITQSTHATASEQSTSGGPKGLSTTSTA